MLIFIVSRLRKDGFVIRMILDTTGLTVLGK